MFLPWKNFSFVFVYKLPWWNEITFSTKHFAQFTFSDFHNCTSFLWWPKRFIRERKLKTFLEDAVKWNNSVLTDSWRTSATRQTCDVASNLCHFYLMDQSTYPTLNFSWTCFGLFDEPKCGLNLRENWLFFFSITTTKTTCTAMHKRLESLNFIKIIFLLLFFLLIDSSPTRCERKNDSERLKQWQRRFIKNSEIELSKHDWK